MFCNGLANVAGAEIEVCLNTLKIWNVLSEYQLKLVN